MTEAPRSYPGNESAMTDRERAIQAIRRGVPLGQVMACSCHRSPPVRNGCFGVCEDAVEAIVASYEAVRRETAYSTQRQNLPACVTVDRVCFRNFPGEFADVPSAFAITADGKEWRLSEIEITRALNAQPLSVAQGSGGCGILWCCHVRGPDDVYAAPDYVTALAWSDAMNEINWKANSKLNIGDPTSFQDCLIKAVPAPWPHSAETHAKNLPESIKGFSNPSSVSSTDREAGK